MSLYFRQVPQRKHKHGCALFCGRSLPCLSFPLTLIPLLKWCSDHSAQPALILITATCANKFLKPSCVPHNSGHLKG